MNNPFLVVLLSLFLGHSAVFAQDVSTIIYGAYDSPPWVIWEEDKAVKPKIGVTPQYIEAIEKSSGKLHFDVRYMSFQRGMVDLKGGKVEMISAPMVESFKTFATPIVKLGDIELSLYTRKSYKAKTLSELPQMQIGYLRGLHLDPLFEAYPQFKAHLLNAESHGFKSMEKGFLDGVISAKAAYNYYLADNDIKDKSYFHRRYIDPGTLYAWVLKENSQKAKFVELVDTITPMLSSGEADAFMQGTIVDFK